ncbi:MAG: hypothetical protein IKP29_07800, partial [Pseudobutyrivibrio sp.]|nr:hypothetical protein [Pseudobutyrivibrio sp.]
MRNKGRNGGRRLFGLVLSMAMSASLFAGTSSIAFAEETKSTYSKTVVNSGDNMNLTKEGTLDWIHFAAGGVHTRKADADEVIHYKALDGVKKINEAGDSALSYTWSDGDEVTTGENVSTAAVYGSQSDEQGIIDEGVGYTLTLDADNKEREFVFTVGIWAADADLLIEANGEEIGNEALSTGYDAVIREYLVDVAAGETVKVKVNQTSKINEWGNITLGGAAVRYKGEVEDDGDNDENPADETPDTPVDSSDFLINQVDILGGSNMNLTGSDILDWIFVDGQNNDRKKDGAGLSIEYLSDSDFGTMTDSKMAYSWSDGTNRNDVNRTTNGIVLIGRKFSLGNLPNSAAVGYRIKVSNAEKDRAVSFVPGVWQGTALVTINEADKVRFSESFSAGGNSVQKKLTFFAQKGADYTIEVKLTAHSNGDGNVTVGGITLKEQNIISFAKENLSMLLEKAKLLDLSNYRIDVVRELKSIMTSSEAILKSEDATADEILGQLQQLEAAYNNCLSAKVEGRYKYETNSGLCSSFGWEGDFHAPIAYIDGSYQLRDRDGIMVSFGVRDIPGKIKWYNAKGYLPCFVSEYSKDGMDYVIENFSNAHVIDGHKLEIAYSRMTVTNNTDETKDLPQVTSQLIPLNDAAKEAETIEPNMTVVREYAIGADRFNQDFNYPSDASIVAFGGFDKNFDEMEAYWNERLGKLATIVELPNESLINAYKAGYIYTLIIRDDVIKNDGTTIKELHVGENGYDIMFDHDTIGIVSTLFTMGDYTYAKEYLNSLPAQLQYDDAKWKFSWPFALYLTKTGDIAFVEEKFDTIKNNTHKVETDRDYSQGGIIKETWAIDSKGYWLIDDWSALAGLSTYKYICDSLYDHTSEAMYLEESKWAKQEYDDLLSCVEKKQKEMRDMYDYPYLSIDMLRPTEQSARSDARDANWASMFLFGRYAWDGYLFGADQKNSEMIDLIDATYEHGFDRRKDISDTIYNFGGYPHGIYSSAYNAGYGSSALRTEKYRDLGIKAYEFMIDKAMSGPFGWWEGVDYPNE